MKSFILIGLFLTTFSYAGTGTSNGGDHVRAQFILKGKEIISYLESTEKGKKIATDFNLNLSNLAKILEIKKIQVLEGPLIDNSGSIVDAIGVPDLIRLDGKRWETLLSSGNDIYYLIFHEMLRSGAVNDDDYVVSFNINPFLKIIQPGVLIPNPTVVATGVNIPGVYIIEKGSLLKIANTKDDKCFILHFNDASSTQLNTCDFDYDFNGDIMKLQKANVGTVFKEQGSCFRKIYYAIQFDRKSWDGKNARVDYRLSEEKIYARCN